MYVQNKVQGQNTIEESGFSVVNLQGLVIVETEQVLEMFECIDGDLRSFWIFE